MKRFTLYLIATVLCTALTHGQNRIVTERDSEGNRERVIELRDTVINGKTVSDTLSITTYTSEDSETADDNDWSFVSNMKQILVPIAAITGVFGTTVLIIFLVFFFRYKNRKAKYRMTQQILESGQPLPENFFTDLSPKKDARNKGISNTFLGLGIFILLWAVTEEFSIGCIGLLIMCIGLGQIVIHYTQERDRKDAEILSEKNEEQAQ